MNSKSSAIIIGDWVVSKFMDNGIRISPLKWKGPNTFEPVATEDRYEANRLLQNLSDGKLTYDELIKTYF
jgi:hypothetical protein